MYLDEETMYNEQVKKCKDYKKNLPNNKWEDINIKNIVKGKIVSASYWTDNQLGMNDYPPLIGKVLKKKIVNGVIEKIIILDQNGNKSNIIKSCNMSFQVLTDIPEIVKKRGNLNSLDYLNESKSSRVSDEIQEIEEQYDSDFYTISPDSD